MDPFLIIIIVLVAIIIGLIIGAIVLVIFKFFSKKKEEAPAPVTTKDCPYCKQTIALEATRCPHCTSQLEA